MGADGRKVSKLGRIHPRNFHTLMQAHCGEFVVDFCNEALGV
jgi:hypothetical protein